MTTCIVLYALITCTNVAPRPSPQEAAAVLTASIPAFTPPYAGTDQLAPLSYTPPRPAPVQARFLPPTSQWTSVTTYVPRFGPPVTWFDGQAPRGYRKTR